MLTSLFSDDFVSKLGVFADYIDDISVIVVVIVVTIILRAVSNKIINRVFKKGKTSKIFQSKIDEGRRDTLRSMTKNLIKYIIYFIALMIIISRFIDIGSILAVAGIGGLILSMGMKSLIEDMIAGFFIIFEDQYNVGELITINGYNGIVEAIGIRTTTIIDYSGDVHSIHNGSVSVVTNHCRKAQRIMFDVTVDYSQQLDQVLNVLRTVCTEISQHEYYEDGPRILGVQQLAAKGYSIRVYAMVNHLMHWDGEREIKQKILCAFKDNEIVLADDMKIHVNASES